jgi:hypothetical protein
MKPQAAVGMLLVAGFATDAYASDQEGLQLELTPYIWGAGIDGKVTADGQTVHFDVGISDLISKVDAGFMGLAVGSYDRFVVYVDYDYIGLSDNANTATGAKVDATIDTTIGTYTAGYRFDTFGENTIDVMIGARTIGLDETIELPNVKVNNDGSLTDTIVMLRPSFRFAENWRFNPTLSYAVSGDSDTSYELSPQIQWDFAKSFAMRFGYKKLFYEVGGNDKLDISLQGLYLGAGWIFPAR